MIRQVSSYMLANIASAMLGFASVVIFTRLLGPYEYGIYIVGFSIAAMISALLFGWIKASIVPFTAHDDGADLRVTTGIAFAALLPLVPVLYFAISAFSPQYSTYLLPAILLAFGIGFFEFYLEVFRAKQQTLPYLWATVLRAAIALALSMTLVMVFNLGGTGLILSVMSSYLITSVLFVALIWRRPLAPLDPTLLRAMLVFGLPMTVSGVVFVLQTMLDRFALAGSMGEHAAGIYGASADLVRQIILFPGVAIGTAVAPIAMQLLARQDRAALNRHLVDSTEMLLGVLAPAVAGLAIIAAKLAHLVLGEEFRVEATDLIPLIALAWLLRSISYQLLHVSFQILKKPNLMLFQGLAILAINGIALFTLVPRFGLMGAAFAVVISEAIGVVIGYWLTRLAYPLPLAPRPFIKVGLATLGMAVPTYLVDRAMPEMGALDITLPILVGVLSYALCAYALDIAGLRTRVTSRYRQAAALTTSR
ncbi:polysaccharide biosynthesis C-terminal domain-containing protein [Devosia sp.]|uniref:oligosaccharide flippase family protein n=1 Tax=Devosia sp. TaxID=1871048 RepID=UPI001AD4AA34|nr:polysaccharide biosynthesis C-terminal domain-containing protein [Devosia sp.]MBN9333993.1 polysaccharide biosynthesis C-terminal domain-containing protein [Devosia sp.]